MSDLLTELLASWGTTPPNALMELVPDRLAGLVGFQKVRASGPYYEPDDGGSWCIVIPIDDDDGLADLLALHHAGVLGIFCFAAFRIFLPIVSGFLSISARTKSVRSSFRIFSA